VSCYEKSYVPTYKMGLTGAREQFWPGALPDKVSALTLLDG